MTINTNPILTADEGMVLFNGRTYAKAVRLGSFDSAENWKEVPEEEFEEWKKKHHPWTNRANNNKPTTEPDNA